MRFLLTWRQRRKLGFTIPNVRRIVKELDAAGELDRDDVAGTSAQVLNRLHAENPQAFQAEIGERDWAEFFEQLLAFLEKILPLIMLFM